VSTEGAEFPYKGAAAHGKKFDDRDQAQVIPTPYWAGDGLLVAGVVTEVCVAFPDALGCVRGTTFSS
jgi:hypothetical protein